MIPMLAKEPGNFRPPVKFRNRLEMDRVASSKRAGQNGFDQCVRPDFTHRGIVTIPVYMPDHRLAGFERVVDTYRKTARRSSHDYALQQDTSDLHLDRLAGSGGQFPSIRRPLVEMSRIGCHRVSPLQLTPARSPLRKRSAFRLHGCSIQTMQVIVNITMLYQLQNSAIELDSPSDHPPFNTMPR